MVSPSMFRRVMFPIVGPTTAGGFSSQCSLSSNSNFVIGHPLLLIKREDFIDIFEIKHVGGIELLTLLGPETCIAGSLTHTDRVCLSYTASIGNVHCSFGEQYIFFT